MKLLRAWAGGFFDGEGSFHVCYYDGNGLSYPQVSISQSGPFGHELLLKFDRAVERLGKIYGPRRPAKNQKLCRFQWEASGIKKVEKIFFLLHPFLGTIKIEQAEKIISQYYKDRS